MSERVNRVRNLFLCLVEFFLFYFQPVGCDLVVNSSARKDRCGVCNGDNTTCDLVEKTFTAQPRKNSEITTISFSFYRQSCDLK